MNPTAGALLGLLNSMGATTGAALAREATESIGDFWTVTRSQVYRELAKLAEQGLVLAGPTGARDARPYSITDAGQTAFRQWLLEGPGNDNVRVPLLLTLAFAEALPARRLAEILTAGELEHREKLQRYQTLEAELIAGDVPMAARATLAFGIRYEQAVLTWLSELPEQWRQGR